MLAITANTYTFAVLDFATYITTFAANGVPGATFLPIWPAFTKENDATLEFSTPSVGGLSGEGIDVVAGIRRNACDFMEMQLNQRNEIETGF